MPSEPMEYRYNREDLQQALTILREGGVILYPTDTVWGIGCDATSEEAVNKVFAIKERMDSKALLLLVDDARRIPSYVEEMPEMAWELMEFSTKPLTIIYDNAKNVAKNLLAPDGSVGIRECKEPFVKALIQQFRKPIVSTSANKSGGKSSAIFSEISEEIKQRVDYIVRYRQKDGTKIVPSSIIKLGTDCSVKIIRK